MRPSDNRAASNLKITFSYAIIKTLCGRFLHIEFFFFSFRQHKPSFPMISDSAQPAPKNEQSPSILNYCVMSGGILFCRIFADLQHTHFHRTGTHLNLDQIIFFHLIRGTGYLSIDQNPSSVTRFIRNRPAFNQPGDF